MGAAPRLAEPIGAKGVLGVEYIGPDPRTQASKRRQGAIPASVRVEPTYYASVVEPAQLRTDRRFSKTLERSPFRATDYAGNAADLMDDQWFSNEHNSALSKREAELLRERCIKKYQVSAEVGSRIKSPGDFVFVDQGGSGGCSFASMTNLAQLAGRTSEWEAFCGPRSLRSVATEKGFRALYEGKLGFDDDGYNSWKLAIQRMEAQHATMTPLLSIFEYKVFRGRGDRQADDLKDSSAEQYADNVCGWIDQKIRDGHVVAVPYANHFCTIIGFSETGYLFLGSYGERTEFSDQGGLHELRLEKCILGDILNDCLCVKVASVSK
jgi:hypothetical protein